MPIRISVITAVYNARDTIAQAIESVAAQRAHHPQLEHIVIDGGSTDGTLEVLQRLREHFDVLVSEPDRGIYDALNKGIARASGDAIGFLHADDFYAQDAVLAKIAAALEQPGTDAVYGDLIYVSKQAPDRVVRHWRSGHYAPRRLKRGWMPPHPTLYMRREVYQRLGGFDLRYRIAADYEHILRSFLQGRLQVRYLPEVLVAMRVGGASNRSLANLWRKTREDHHAIRRHGAGGLTSLLIKNLSKLPQFFQRRRSI